MICLYCESWIEDWDAESCPACGHEFTGMDLDQMHDDFVDYYFSEED